MQQVDRPLPLARGVFFTELIGPAENIRPFHWRVNQYPVTQVFLDLVESDIAIRCRHLRPRGRISQRIAHFDAVKRREGQRPRSSCQERARRHMVRVITMERDKKRGIGVSIRFHESVAQP